MRVPLSWLRDYVEFEATADELARRLTLGGLEVAAIERLGADWQGISVGEIVEVEKHPQADRLQIARVDCGSGEVRLSVTGAPNVEPGQHGQKVAVAKPGARLHSGHDSANETFIVAPTRLRGVDSEIVLCSEKELGLSDDHTGILLLDSEAPVGQPLNDLLGDTVFELELTPNLSRCLSVIGLTREIGGLLDGRLKLSEPRCKAEGAPLAGRVEVEIVDADLCARYTAMLIENVSNGQSPAWMRRRLQLAGMRPINTIVDITNYVMLEWGQPLHAFDFDILRERADGKAPRITIRRARAGETITTLDGVARTLDKETLIIADERGPIAIAGVMGGLETEVSEKTRAVLLESANFDNINNRRTAQRLKLTSEASLRFTRGIPSELTLRAARRAVELMREHAQGVIAEGVVDVYPRKQRQVQITLEPREVKRILGLPLSKSRITTALLKLDFKCEPDGKALRVTVPWHRLDVEIPADVIEEIARVIGYDRLPEALIAESPPMGQSSAGVEREETVRDLLVSCGLTEVITYSLSNPAADAQLYPTDRAPLGDKYLKLANPMSSERAYLRRSLMAQLLETVAENQRHHERVLIFEIGRVYLPEKVASDGLPSEPRRLSLALSGPRHPLSWNEAPSELDFFDLKGIIITLLQGFGVSAATFAPITQWPFHPGRAAELRINDVALGSFGEVHPEVAERFKLKGQTMLAELDLEALLARSAEVIRHYQPSPRFPVVAQDLAIILPENIPAARVEALIWRAGQPLLSEIRLFDVYKGEQVPAGQRSLAYSLHYLAPDRTLTDEEVQAVHAKIQTTLARELGAKVRGVEP
jgi:phenylalanyl-tRNA synthetase beta chain